MLDVELVSHGGQNTQPNEIFQLLIFDNFAQSGLLCVY